MVAERQAAPELLLSELSPTALVGIDADGTVVAWDDGARELFGYERAEALGVALGELVIPARLRAAHEHGLRRARTDGLVTLVDTRLDMPAVHRDGHEFHVELVVTREGEHFVGRLRGLDGPAPVSGELYCAAKAHQRRERAELARLTTLVESLRVGVLVLDEHHRVVLANTAFVELFAIGSTPEQLRGTALTVPGDPPDHVLERDHAPVTLDGAALGHLWVFRDVTAQSAVRRGLEERNRLLLEVSSLKTEFVRVASHELRTPLTSIATFAAMLEDEGALDAADRLAAVTAIRRNADRMQVLVADLLLLAQLESGETTLSLGPVDVAAVVREIHPAAQVGAGPVTEADEALLWQLLSTAIGVVVAAADPDAPVAVAATAGGTGADEQWTVRVSTATDQPATAERLLSVRLPHPDAEGEHRTGALALMLAREIAARHGGKLTTAVDVDGMTVTVELPIRRA
jgi:PAS domain S-box-containing protein